MALYGILNSTTNTGIDSELNCVFATPVSIVSNKPENMSDTLSLKRVGAATGAQRWEVQAQIAQMSDATDFFINTVTKGKSNKVYIRMPPILKQTMTPAGMTPTVNGTFSAGVNVVTTAGFTNCKKGEFIQFASHSKVYLVTNYASNNITIEPPLVSLLSTGTSIKYGDLVTLHAKMDTSSIIGITYENGTLASPGQYKFVEAL